MEQNGEGGQWKIVVCLPGSGLLGRINVGHGRCQASGLVYSVYTQFEFFVAMEDICVPNSLRSGTGVINVGQS